MFPTLLVLFVIMPIAEISVLLRVGETIGGINTVGLVILTAVVGASLVKSQGLQTWFEVNRRMQSGELPGQQIVEGLLLLIAGVLLVTPGFITDFVGIIIVTPMFRPMIAKNLVSKLNVRIVGNFQQSPFQPPPQDQSPRNTSGDTFEGEYKRRDEE